MSTETLFEEEVELKEQIVKKHNLILFNDDVNSFDHVIDLLIKVCNHEPIQAEQCAMLVHYAGKCAVKTGEYQELEIISEILADCGLTVEIN